MDLPSLVLMAVETCALRINEASWKVRRRMDPDPEWPRREKADRVLVVLVPGFRNGPTECPVQEWRSTGLMATAKISRGV